MSRLVLASGSQWRAKLLSWIGLEFEVVVSGFDESKFTGMEAGEMVEKLAVAKARVVCKQINDSSVVVLGADTAVVVEHEGKTMVLGKPKDIEEARQILMMLRGKEHRVFTGVAILADDKEKFFVEESRVRFREFSEKDLLDYLATGESMGKAGAYMILGQADSLIEGVVGGGITNVIGLPVRRTVEELEKVGIEVGSGFEEIIEANTRHKD